MGHNHKGTTFEPLGSDLKPVAFLPVGLVLIDFECRSWKLVLVVMLAEVHDCGGYQDLESVSEALVTADPSDTLEAYQDMAQNAFCSVTNS